MICPFDIPHYNKNKEMRYCDYECAEKACAIYDTKKKQCAILTIAQKDNSKVSVAR